jgi:hypothetical protein
VTAQHRFQCPLAIGARRKNPTSYICPDGYFSDDSSMPWQEVSNSHREGVLCGDCVPGFAAAFGTDECVEDSSCDASPWFFPVLALGGLCYLALVLMVPINSHPLWKSTTYFLQIVPLIMRLTHNPVFGVVLALFSLEPSILGVHVKVCLWPGLTPLHKMALNYLIPFLLLIELSAVYIARMFGGIGISRIVRAINERKRKQEEVFVETEESQVYNEPLMQDSIGQKDAVSRNKVIEIGIIETEHGYAAGLMGLMLFMYEGVTGSKMNILTCILLDDNQSVLYRAGGVGCYQSWWYALIVLLCVILYLMFLFFLLSLQ